MDVGLTQPEEDMDPGRLNIGVDDANAAAVAGEQRSQVGRRVRFPGATAVRVDRDDLPQGASPRSAENPGNLGRNPTRRESTGQAARIAQDYRNT